MHHTYEIINVENLKYVKQVSAAISGMSGSVFCAEEKLRDERVTLPLEAHSDGGIGHFGRVPHLRTPRRERRAAHPSPSTHGWRTATVTTARWTLRSRWTRRRTGATCISWWTVSSSPSPSPTAAVSSPDVEGVEARGRGNHHVGMRHVMKHVRDNAYRTTRI